MVLTASAMLAGCANDVRLSTGQALLVAEAGVDGVNHAAIIAAQTGIVKGAKAQAAKDALDAANQAVSSAKAARDGDSATFTKTLTDALGKIADAQKDLMP